MPTFNYSGVDGKGLQVSGSIAASDMTEARNKLRELSVYRKRQTQPPLNLGLNTS